MSIQRKEVDTTRALKFMAEFRKALTRKLASEKHPGIRKELEEMFEEQGIQELQKLYETERSMVMESKTTYNRHKVPPEEKPAAQVSSGELIRLMDRNRERQHAPEQTASFLSLFSSDPDLKYVTHSWDQSLGAFSLSEFLYRVKVRLKKAILDHPEVPFQTMMKVYTFLLDPELKSGWGYEHIKTGWSTADVKDWCRNHEGVFPDKMPLPRDKRVYHLRGKTRKYQRFGDLIQKFRKDIRFVNEGNHLTTFLTGEAQAQGLYADHRPEFDTRLNGLDCFVDVDKVGAGLKYIFSGIKMRRECPDVVFSGRREDGKVILTISQKGGKIERSSPEEERIRPDTLAGDFKDAHRLLTSQCDWTFEGPFSNRKAWAMHYLRPEGTAPITPSSCTDEIKHTLTFYSPSHYRP